MTAHASDRFALVSSIVTPLGSTDLAAVATNCSTGVGTVVSAAAGAFWTALAAAVTGRTAVSVGSLATSAALTENDWRYVDGAAGALAHPWNRNQGSPATTLGEPPFPQSAAWMFLWFALNDFGYTQGWAAQGATWPADDGFEPPPSRPYP